MYSTTSFFHTQFPALTSSINAIDSIPTDN